MHRALGSCPITSTVVLRSTNTCFLPTRSRGTNTAVCPSCQSNVAKCQDKGCENDYFPCTGQKDLIDAMAGKASLRERTFSGFGNSRNVDRNEDSFFCSALSVVSDHEPRARYFSGPRTRLFKFCLSDPAQIANMPEI